MLRTLPYLAWSIPAFALHLLAALPDAGWRHIWKRVPLFFGMWLLFTLLNLLHLAGHLLDELLFPGYRRQPVTRPVFITGIPRSGTTYLQRLLGKHPGFSTFSTWEALLAPSLTERHLFRLLGLLLKPLDSGIVAARRKLFQRMDHIHRVRLLEPEEDFLLLLPLLGCFLLVFPCPQSASFWALGKADSAVSDRRRRRFMAYYDACLKKQLYYHGGNLRLLSKNPSFTSWIPALLDYYPDAQVIACTRPPLEVVPSQLSAIRPAMNLLGGHRLSPAVQDGLMETLHHYYGLLGQLRQDGRIFFLPMNTLRNNLEVALTDLARFLGDNPDHSPITTLVDGKAGDYQSKHQYSLADFHLAAAIVENRFSDVWPLPGEQAAQRNGSLL